MKFYSKIGNDDHNSIYNLNWIKSQHRPEMRPRIITWDGNEVEQKLLLVESEENNLTEDGVKQLLKSLLQFGVAIVKNVRTNNVFYEITVKIKFYIIDI